MSRRDEKNAFNRPFAGLSKIAPKEPPKPALVKKEAAPATKLVDKSTLTDDELFLREVGGAAPIERKGGRVGTPPVERKAKPVSDDAEVLASLADLCDGNGAFDIADTDEFVEGVADGVDKRLLRRLRAGEYAVQAHVDLHGLTREEARIKVDRFVVESRKAGRRCVLIVHGRGLHSKDSIPVLKSALKAWLERGPLARAVLAFATARPHDGGAGAVYVLLRK